MSEPLPFSDTSVVRDSDLYSTRLIWTDKANSWWPGHPKGREVNVRYNLVFWHHPQTRTNSRSSILLECFR